MPIIQNWDDTESLLHHCFYNELTLAPEEHPIMFILPSSPFTTSASKEKLTQIMFETFSVPAFYIGDSSVLSLIACGRTHGLVIDSGHINTYVVPVCEAVSNPHVSFSTDIAGLYLTERLSTLLLESGYDMSGSSMRSILEDIKKKACYVTMDYQAELKNRTREEFSYELPDLTKVVVRDESFKTPEILFQPSLDGFKDDGVVQMAVKSIKRCDQDIQDTLLQNIVLTGGTSLLKGYSARFEKELKPLMEQPFKVLAPPERGNLAWIGGSILSSLSWFEKAWISKDEYDEIGPTIVNKKCF